MARENQPYAYVCQGELILVIKPNPAMKYPATYDGGYALGCDVIGLGFDSVTCSSSVDFAEEYGGSPNVRGGISDGMVQQLPKASPYLSREFEHEDESCQDHVYRYLVDDHPDGWVVYQVDYAKADREVAVNTTPVKYFDSEHDALTWISDRINEVRERELTE